MTPAARRAARASLLLLILVITVAGVVFAPPAVPRVESNVTGSIGTEPSYLTTSQGNVFAFFNDGRATTGAGRGLFETDFFKPAPAPSKPAEKPAPPPPPRNLAIVYRGLAAFPGGARVAYVTVDGRVHTLSAGEAVAEGWSLLAFDGEQAELVKGEARITLPFNRSAAVPVATKP